jgi:hypothetical protein
MFAHVYVVYIYDIPVCTILWLLSESSWEKLWGCACSMLVTVTAVRPTTHCRNLNSSVVYVLFLIAWCTAGLCCSVRVCGHFWSTPSWRRPLNVTFPVDLMPSASCFRKVSLYFARFCGIWQCICHDVCLPACHCPRIDRIHRVTFLMPLLFS